MHWFISVSQFLWQWYWTAFFLPYTRNHNHSPVFLIWTQVHPYTYRNENKFLHFDFHQDPYEEYDYWLNNIRVDGLFTDFTGSLHNFQEWTSPLSKDGGDDNTASKLLHKIALLISSYKNWWDPNVSPFYSLLNKFEFIEFN